MTKYGKSTTTPIIYPLDFSQSAQAPSLPYAPSPGTPSRRSSTPKVTGGTSVDDGKLTFQALTSGKVTKATKRSTISQERTLYDQMRRLQQNKSLRLRQPLSSEAELSSMFIKALRTQNGVHQPLLTLGDWIISMPSRVGLSRAVTMAAEFFIHSYGVFCNETHSKRTLALQTKGKALKELQSCIIMTQQPTYELLLATKLHYAAEVSTMQDNQHSLTEE
jgi:hypothetical protein